VAWAERLQGAPRSRSDATPAFFGMRDEGRMVRLANAREDGAVDGAWGEARRSSSTDVGIGARISARCPRRAPLGGPSDDEEVPFCTRRIEVVVRAATTVRASGRW